MLRGVREVHVAGRWWAHARIPRTLRPYCCGRQCHREWAPIPRYGTRQHKPRGGCVHPPRCRRNRVLRRRYEWRRIFRCFGRLQHGLGPLLPWRSILRYSQCTRPEQPAPVQYQPHRSDQRNELVRPPVRPRLVCATVPWPQQDPHRMGNAHPGSTFQQCWWKHHPQYGLHCATTHLCARS